MTSARQARTRLQPGDRELLGALFSLDKRSLAVVRIGIALFLLYDSQVGYLGATGFLGSTGDPIWNVLRIVVIVPAVMLLMGWRTRLATGLCWLIYSHAIRTSFSMAGAPVPFESQVLTLTLLWGMFLPLGAVASMDARRAPPPEKRGFLSVASAALMIQVFLIYFSAGITKSLSEWLLEPTALLDVLSNPSHGTALGQTLTGYPGLLAILSVVTVVVEIVGPILLFLPGKNLARRRTVLVAAFVGFHVMLAMLMTLGTFPIVMIIVWCAFLPSRFWARNDDTGVEVDTNRWRAWLSTALLAMVVASNVITWAFFPADSGVPAVIQDVARYLAVYQQWTMYSVPSTL